MGELSHVTENRTEPARVGERVAGTKAAAQHGGPRVVAFHPSDWDIARADELHAYERLASAVMGDIVPDVIAYANDSRQASLFGVYGRSAVFVVDEHDTLLWRHVAGLDPIDSVRPSRSLADLNADSCNDDSRICTRREFLATAIGASLALMLTPALRRAEAAVHSLRARGLSAQAETLRAVRT
jgi:hypothetical protein